MIESLQALFFNEKTGIVIGFIAASIALLQYIHQRKQKTDATAITNAEQVVAAKQVSGNAITNKQSFEASELSQPVFVEGNAANIQITGVPFEQYRQDLDKKEQEIRELIKQNSELQHSASDTVQSDPNNAQRQHELKTELAAVQHKLQNTESSYQEYIQELEERIKRLEALKGQLPDNVIDAAKQALQNGDNKQADQLLAKVQEQAEAPIKVAAEASFQRAKIAKDNIDYHNALTHYERAAQLAPDNTKYLNDYGLMLREMGDMDSAIVYLEQALAIDRKTRGEDHPSVATRRNNLGLAWQDKGELNKAIVYLEQALTIVINTHGEQHPYVATSRNNMGSAWHQKGELDKAIDCFEQALASDINTYDEHHPAVSRDRNNLGLVWYDKGALDKAIEYFELALASDINIYGEHHPSVARGRNNLGSAWQGKGKLDNATEYMQLAFDGYRKVYGDEHYLTKRAKANLEKVQLKRAKQLEAEK